MLLLSPGLGSAELMNILFLFDLISFESDINLTWSMLKSVRFLENLGFIHIVPSGSRQYQVAVGLQNVQPSATGPFHLPRLTYR